MKKGFLNKKISVFSAVALMVAMSGFFLTPAYGDTANGASVAELPALPDTGSIQVTKEISMYSPDDSIRVNDTFYAAVFDGSGQRISDIKEIIVTDSLPSTVIFEGLPLDHTYYVCETDQTGEIIQIDGEDYGYIIDPTVKEWTYIAYEGRVIELSAAFPVGYTTITNYFFPEVQPGWYGTVTALLSVDGDEDSLCSTQTLYGALFYDEQHKIRATEALPFLKTGSDIWSATFEKDLDGNPLVVGETYYFAMTTKEGDPIENPEKVYGCAFSADMELVTVTEAGTTLHLSLAFPLDVSPQTGDENSFNWLFLVTGPAAAAAVFISIFRKRADKMSG